MTQIHPAMVRCRLAMTVVWLAMTIARLQWCNSSLQWYKFSCTMGYCKCEMADASLQRYKFTCNEHDRSVQWSNASLQWSSFNKQRSLQVNTAHCKRGTIRLQRANGPISGKLRSLQSEQAMLQVKCYVLQVGNDVEEVHLYHCRQAMMPLQLIAFIAEK